MDDKALASTAVSSTFHPNHGVSLFHVEMLSHYDEIMRFLRTKVENIEIAADLTQETFLFAIEHVAQLRDPTYARSWLYSICKRRLATYWRSSIAQQRRELVSLPNDGPNLTSAWQVDMEGQIQVSQMLQSLPCISRQLVWMNCCEGFTAREIAQHLNLSATAIERRLSRAKAQLRDEILQHRKGGDVWTAFHD